MSIVRLQIGMDWDPVLDDYSLALVDVDHLIPNDHEFLFQFLDYNLSRLEQPLAEYLSCLGSGLEPVNSLLRSSITELGRMHPYFLLCRENAVLFLNRVFAGYVRQHFPTLSTAEQKDLFFKVCVSDHADPDQLDSLFENPLESGERYILDHLYRIQKEIRVWVYLTLDDTHPELAALSSKRRSAMYGHIAGINDYRPSLELVTRFSTLQSPRMKKASAKWDFVDIPDVTEEGQSEGRQKRKAKKEPLDHYSKLQMAVDSLLWDPAAPLPTVLKEVIAATKDVEDCELLTYCIDSFSDLLKLEVYRMILAEKRIRRCKNCGRFFVVEKPDQEFCDRLAPNSDLLCSKIGPSRTGKNKGSAGDTDAAGTAKSAGVSKNSSADAFLQKIYRKAYGTRHQRVRRQSMSEADFKSWIAETKQKMELVKQEKLDVADFEEWLKL